MNPDNSSQFLKVGVRNKFKNQSSMDPDMFHNPSV